MAILGAYFDMLRPDVKDNLDALQRVAKQALTGAQYAFGLLYVLAERCIPSPGKGPPEEGAGLAAERTR